MLLYLNIIIAIIFILQKNIKIFNDAEEKIIKCNDPPLNLFGIDLNMENTYKLIYFIFFLIIGIVLSFNIITTLTMKKLFKYILYGTIIFFIFLLDLLRNYIKCIGRKNVDGNTIYFFSYDKYYNTIIFILLLINVCVYPTLISNHKKEANFISKLDETKKLTYNLIHLVKEFLKNRDSTEIYKLFKDSFKDNYVNYLNFENFNYLFIFTFLITFIPNFIPNIETKVNTSIDSAEAAASNFNMILYIIFGLFYLFYTVNNIVDFDLIDYIIKDKIGRNLNSNRFLLIIIIILITYGLYKKQDVIDYLSDSNDLTKYNNFIYFSIIIFCFLLIFLLKNELFFNPFEKLSNLIGLNWKISLFIFTIIIILSFVYFMIHFYLKKSDITKCTKENIKKYLLKVTNDNYEDNKNELCKYFNATNQLELINKINSFNFDEDGCFNYNDLIKILKKIQKKKIYLDNDFKDIKYHIIIVIGIISAFLYKQLKKFNIKGRKKSILTLLFFSVNSYFITNINNSTIYKSCEINKVKCKDKLGDNCKDKYYKMDFNKQLNEWITYALISSFLIIAVMFYYNILNTQKLIEKDKIFIICFVIIIIICSFLLLQNNIIQN